MTAFLFLGFHFESELHFTYAKSFFVFFETFHDESRGFFNRLVGNVDDRAAELFVKLHGKIKLGLNIVHIGISGVGIQAVGNHALPSDVVQNRWIIGQTEDFLRVNLIDLIRNVCLRHQRKVGNLIAAVCEEQGQRGFGSSRNAQKDDVCFQET